MRLVTDGGPVHVWRPAGYGGVAGVVIYVHGYYDTADSAWATHDLADQFAASAQDALFLVPEAPASGDEEPRWGSPGDLLRAVKHAGVALPDGPIVVVGHSGAYRQILLWLDYPIDSLILLDALYGNEEDFLDWLERARGHRSRRLTVVAQDTLRFADPFAKRVPKAEVIDGLPASYEAMTPEQKKAKLLYIRTPADHMGIITDGKTIPLVLRRTPLRSLAKVPPP